MLNTYQDLIAVGDNDVSRIEFVSAAIHNYKASKEYKDAWIAEQYFRHKNVTINEFQKLLYTVSGKAIPDNFNANYKMACNHFRRFIIQQSQFLLGNGVTWDKEGVDLGNARKPFDTQIQILAEKALIHRVSYGFWNLDHVDVFSALEFVPLFDEENGSLRAGIRFWQIDETKPLRATLYEEDGYTDYIWKPGKPAEILRQKTAYALTVSSSVVDGVWISDGENYPSFPIIPFWGNMERESELVGLREQIDCYDLIKSGFANTVDEASFVYWTIQNAGGMDEVDLATFIERMQTVHAAVIDDDGAKAESHQLEAPSDSREKLLDRLDRDLYRDAMALDIEHIASGAATATEILASYEPLNSKADRFEYCVREFISQLLEVAGIEANPNFTRSMMTNQQETINALMSASSYLTEDYITRKVLSIFGDSDMADEMIEQRTADDLNKFGLGGGDSNEADGQIAE